MLTELQSRLKSVTFHDIGLDGNGRSSYLIEQGERTGMIRFVSRPQTRNEEHVGSLPCHQGLVLVHERNMEARLVTAGIKSMRTGTIDRTFANRSPLPGLFMRKVVGGLIQMSNPVNDPGASVAKIAAAMEEKHLPYIEEAGKKGVQILCLQEVFNGPYFCPSQDAKWCDIAEAIPDGPTIQRMQKLAKKHQMAMIVPIYEREMAGVYYNTAAVIDADGSYLGKYRKNHIPHTAGFWEKFFFKPGNLGYPVFKTRYATIGIYICYDRHFPEGARLLGLHGAEIVFNPSATVKGLSQYLWKLEQPAHAVANGYFMGCSNRVGTEAPWNIGQFYGSSYFVDPRGNFLAQGSEDRDELVVAEMNLDMIEEVRRTWQFFRDRRPETYDDMVRQLP